MAAMMLADLGATVLRIERLTESDLGIKRPIKYDLLMRGRKAIALDLKNPDSVEIVLRLIKSADGLIEGFRPGVMERLGLGPDVCLERNPKLIFGRVTGWGQDGPLAQVAGHDLNFIALTGALNAIGRKHQKPVPPLNLVGDFAGGAAYLVIGMLSALLEAQRSGKGQVVDAAMVDGTAHLMTSAFGLFAAGLLSLERGENLADSGSFFYEVYECKDGKLISIAPIEAKFFAEFLHRIGISANALPLQSDKSSWERGKALLTDVFAQRTRGEWCELLEGTDVCFAPVLSMSEAPDHPHMKARGVFTEVDGVVQPVPAPRFSRTSPDPPSPPQRGADTRIEDALKGWMSPEQISALGSSEL